MPHTRSAAKRLRQSEERRSRNKSRSTELKGLKKRIQRALHDGKKDEASQLYRIFDQRLSQAASVRTIHPNTAARQKARVAKAIAAAKPSAS